MTDREKEELTKCLDLAEKKFKEHMDHILGNITSSAEDEYEDENIEERIESNGIIFDIDGNIID